MIETEAGQATFKICKSILDIPTRRQFDNWKTAVFGTDWSSKDRREIEGMKKLLDQSADIICRKRSV